MVAAGLCFRQSQELSGEECRYPCTALGDQQMLLMDEPFATDEINGVQNER